MSLYANNFEIRKKVYYNRQNFFTFELFEYIPKENRHTHRH